MSVPSSLTSAGLVTAGDTLPSNITTTEGYDSGYGSGGGMEGREKPHGFRHTVEGAALPQHGLIERKVKLRVFDEAIPKSTQYRFADLYELLETPLYDYLTKAKAKSSGHAIKLRVLGECEDSARPWILVLCHKTAARWIKRFFNQSQIKAEYQPSSVDPYRASFQICICNGPPKLMAATEMVEVYGGWDEYATLCGQVIEVGKNHQTRIATLGGVIQVVTSDASCRCYGMTAGHIVNRLPLEEPEQDESGDREDSENQETTNEESEDSQTSEGEHGLGLGVELDGIPEELDVAVQSSPVIMVRTRCQNSWPLKGHVSMASDPTYEPDLDWALLEFDDKGTMNWSNSFSRADHRLSGPLKELAVVPTEADPDRTVILLSGIGGLKPGMLSTSVSYLNMGRTKASTKTYTLILSPNVVIDPGDCGSWVVDHETYEVYGYVVASDILGEVYVVPLHAALHDITDRLAAISASLPTGQETQGSVNQHSEIKLSDRHSTAPQPPRPPPPNPFLKLPALERLRADIDRVNPAIDLSLQCLPYNLGDRSNGYDERLGKSQHQVHNPSKVALSDLRRGGNLYHTYLSSNKPNYDTDPGLNKPQIADGRRVFSSRPHHSSGRTHDVTVAYSEGALVSYEGYTFTREIADSLGRKRTWAYCRRDPLHVTQEHLKERLRNERRELASKQYNAPEMDGYKRGQVHRLLTERNADETMVESGFEYGLASVKLQGQVEDGLVTTTRMVVILQRQPRRKSGPWLLPRRAPPIAPPVSESTVIDLSGWRESEIAQDHFSGRKFASTLEATVPPVHDNIPRVPITHKPTHDSLHFRVRSRDELQEADFFREEYNPVLESFTQNPGKRRDRTSSSSSSSSSENSIFSETTNITGPTVHSGVSLASIYNPEGKYKSSNLRGREWETPPSNIASTPSPGSRDVNITAASKRRKSLDFPKRVPIHPRIGRPNEIEHQRPYISQFHTSDREDGVPCYPSSRSYENTIPNHEDLTGSLTNSGPGNRVPEPDLTFEEIYGPRRPANSTDPPNNLRRRRNSDLEASERRLLRDM